MSVLFPFGHGLSYTQFEYSALSAEGTPSKGVTVRMKIRNVGERAGKEVVQLYVGNRTGKSGFAVRELKGFEKIFLKAGEARQISFKITSDMLKFYNYNLDFVCEPGDFEVMIGTDSRNVNKALFTLH